MSNRTEMLDALVQAVKDWRLAVQAGPEYLVMSDGGKKNYTPAKRAVPILRYVENLDGAGTDDPEGLLAEFKRIIGDPTFESTGSDGWDRGLEQHAPQALWEWIIMDRSARYAQLFTDPERAVVARSVAHSYDRLQALRHDDA